MARRTWGSVRKRGQNKWEIRWPKGVDAKTGERLRGYETFYGTRKEAEQRLAEIRVRHKGDVDLTRSITVDEFWSVYFKEHCKDLAPSTVRCYKGHYRASIAPYYSKRMLESITHKEIQDWLNQMTYGKARSAFGLFRTMFNLALELELIDSSPFDRKLKLPEKDAKAKKVNSKVYTLEEMIEVFEACRGEVWEPVFITCAFGGLRRSESFGLKLEDVKASSNGALCIIKRGVQLNDGEVIITKVKTEESKREVIIPYPYASRLLEIVRKELENGYIWLMDDGFGDPLNPDTIACSYKRWFSNNPYTYIPFKNLRNSYATALHEKGVDLGMVAKLLGHTTPTITYQHYDKPSVDAKGKAVESLGAELPPTAPNSNIIQGHWGNDKHKTPGKTSMNQLE